MEIVRIGLEKLRGHRLRANVMRAEVKAKLRRHMKRPFAALSHLMTRGRLL